MAWHCVPFSTGEKEAALVWRVPATVGQRASGHRHRSRRAAGDVCAAAKGREASAHPAASPEVTQLGHCFGLARLQ